MSKNPKTTGNTMKTIEDMILDSNKFKYLKKDEREYIKTQLKSLPKFNKIIYSLVTGCGGRIFPFESLIRIYDKRPRRQIYHAYFSISACIAQQRQYFHKNNAQMKPEKYQES